MIKFCKCGSNMFICQECGKNLCRKGCDRDKKLSQKRQPSEWVEGKGNVCHKCLNSFYLRSQNFKWIKVHQTLLPYNL